MRWYLPLLLIPLAGCGAGNGMASFGAGNYSGSVSDTATTSVIVNLKVAPNGVITGDCALLKQGSPAVIARCDLVGAINTATGSFEASGTYYLTIPPPPGWPTNGPITVTGNSLQRTVASNPMHVTRDINSGDGVLNPMP